MKLKLLVRSPITTLLTIHAQGNLIVLYMTSLRNFGTRICMIDN